MSAGVESNVLIGKTDPKDTAHPYPTVQLDPRLQHVPLDPARAHLRPPPPAVSSSSSDRSQAQIWVGAAAYRDGQRCGNTVHTALSRAAHPDRVRVAVADQTLDDRGDLTCREAYCRLAREAALQRRGSSTDDANDDAEDCPRLSQIVFSSLDASTSRGPVVARHHLQTLIGPADEFCLNIDGHSLFTNGWDVALLADWAATNNEMGIVTTYVHDESPHVISGEGDNRPHAETPHICDVRPGGHGLPRNEGATNVRNATAPLLQSKWGGGFAFGKCHAERRVPIDGRAAYVFDGEEFSRAALLWTAGYDFYSPTMYGHAVYHNYTKNPVTTTWGDQRDREKNEREDEMGANRIKLHVGQPFVGRVDTTDLARYGVAQHERARTLEQFYNFTGVVFGASPSWNHRCHQLHWVPYVHPEVVEAVVPGWRQEPREEEPQEVGVGRDDAAATPAAANAGGGGGGGGGAPCDSVPGEGGKVHLHYHDVSNESFLRQCNRGLLGTNFVLVLLLLSFLVERARRKGKARV